MYFEINISQIKEISNEVGLSKKTTSYKSYTSSVWGDRFDSLLGTTMSKNMNVYSAIWPNRNALCPFI